MQFCISIKRARIISQLPQALENWLELDLLQQIVIKIVEISLFGAWFTEYKGILIFFISFQYGSLHEAQQGNKRGRITSSLPFTPGGRWSQKSSLLEGKALSVS